MLKGASTRQPGMVEAFLFDFESGLWYNGPIYLASRPAIPYRVTEHTPF